MAEVSIIAALAKALPELESAKKNKANPAFKSKYADLAAVIEALEPIRKHGLWYRQVLHESSEGVNVETIYIHEGGDTLSAGSLYMPATKRDAQGFGSALTYARRYSLQSAFGLATEDDDGNAAVKSTAPQQQFSAAQQPISAAEWGIITDLITQTGTDAKAFCEAFKIASVKDLLASDFNRARAMLNKKLAGIAKPETNATADDLGDSIPY